jgi:hypothetical protein
MKLMGALERRDEIARREVEPVREVGLGVEGQVVGPFGAVTVYDRSTAHARSVPHRSRSRHVGQYQVPSPSSVALDIGGALRLDAVT